MILLSLRFPAGRVHATPPGSHANEGRVEWPPSPWRIARALVATYFKMESPPPYEDARSAILALASNAPRYRLPRASEGHTRHYMPNAKSTTKVIDAFVSTSTGCAQDGGVSGALILGWSVDLTTHERVALQSILESLTYLGRAESWVIANLCQEPPDRWDMVPDEGCGEDLYLPALLQESHWAAWKSAFLADFPGKRRPNLGATNWDALVVETRQLQKEGWSSPPGQRLIHYRMPDGATTPLPSPRPSPPGGRPTLAWFRLGGPVLPKDTYATWIAERVRVSLMALTTGVNGRPSPTFSGHTEDGGAASGHGHAWFLPADEDGDGFLDHIGVWAPAGLGQRECDALGRLVRLWGDAHDLAVWLLGIDHPGNGFGPTWAEAHTVWRSATPFVCDRHPKRRNGGIKDGVEDQIRNAWVRHWAHRRHWPGSEHLPEKAPEVEVVLLPPAGQIACRWRQFRLDRPRRGPFGATSGRHHVELRFSAPIQGPLALGAGAHFGLGRFDPLHV